LTGATLNSSQTHLPTTWACSNTSGISRPSRSRRLRVGNELASDEFTVTLLLPSTCCKQVASGLVTLTGSADGALFRQRKGVKKNCADDYFTAKRYQRAKPRKEKSKEGGGEQVSSRGWWSDFAAVLLRNQVPNSLGGIGACCASSHHLVLVSTLCVTWMIVSISTAGKPLLRQWLTNLSK